MSVYRVGFNFKPPVIPTCTLKIIANALADPLGELTAGQLDLGRLWKGITDGRIGEREGR